MPLKKLFSKSSENKEGMVIVTDEENEEGKILPAIKFSFRAPKAGEFGSKHLQDAILYIDINFTSKNLFHFLGAGEYSAQSIWSTLKGDRKVLVECGSYCKDGSYPIDELELPVNNLAGHHLDHGGDMLGRTKFVNMISKAVGYQNDRDFAGHAVITKRATPEAFIAEVEEFMTLRNYNEFDEMLRFIVTLRNDDFGMQKERPYVKALCAKFLGETPTLRSSQQQSDYKGRVWDAIVKDDPQPKATDVFDITDSEKLTYLFEKGGKSGAIPILVDEKSTIEMALDKEVRNEIYNGDSFFVGRVSSDEKLEAPNALPLSFIVSPGPMEGSDLNLKLEFSAGYTTFNATVIGAIKSSGRRGSGNVDVNKAQWFMERTEAEFPDCASERPGYMMSMKPHMLPKLLEMSKKLGDGISGLEVNMVPDNFQASNWTEYMCAQVPCTAPPTNDRITVYTLRGEMLRDCTKDTLNKMERSLCEMYPGHYRHPDKFKVSPGNTLKEEMQERLAVSMEHVYGVIKEDVNLALKISLGAHKLDRPYMVSSYDSVQRCPDVIANSVMDVSGLNKKRGTQDVGLNTSLLVAVAWARQALGSAEAVVEEARKYRDSLTSKPIKGRIAPPSVGGAKVDLNSHLRQVAKDTGVPCEPWGQEIDVLKLNDDYGLIYYMISAGLNECIEDECYVNFSSVERRKVVKPRDVILNMLQTGNGRKFELIRSVYAEEEVCL